MVSWNEFIESLNAASDLYEDITGFNDASFLFWAYEVLAFSDLGDWDSDMLVVNNLGDAFVQNIVSSWSEWNWGAAEKLIGLSFDLILSDLIFLVWLNKMLVGTFISR